MRPRLIAAENVTAQPETRSAWWSFNEAAADCRGKPVSRIRSPTEYAGFNEAAADCRGKPVASVIVPPAKHLLQ